MSEAVRTITITEDKSGVFIATSDEEPLMFCADTSLSGVFRAVERVLQDGACERLPAYDAEYRKLFAAAASLGIDELAPLIRNALAEQRSSLKLSELGQKEKE